MAKFTGVSDVDNNMVNPIKGPGLDTPMVTGIIVLSALGMLILIRRGFRGVNVMGAGVSIG